jgi:hypothetical protein
MIGKLNRRSSQKSIENELSQPLDHVPALQNEPTLTPNSPGKFSLNPNFPISQFFDVINPRKKSSTTTASTKQNDQTPSVNFLAFSRR